MGILHLHIPRITVSRETHRKGRIKMTVLAVATYRKRLKKKGGVSIAAAVI
jgi:hypothetical protein